MRSCVKMRYKGDYAPSELLCPRSLSCWVPLADCIAALDADKYAALDPAARADPAAAEDARKARSAAIAAALSSVPIFYRRAAPDTLHVLRDFASSEGRAAISRYLLSILLRCTPELARRLAFII